MLLFKRVSNKINNESDWKSKPSLCMEGCKNLALRCVNSKNYYQVNKDSYIVNDFNVYDVFDIYVDTKTFYFDEHFDEGKLDDYCIKIYLIYKFIKEKDENLYNKISGRNIYLYGHKKKINLVELIKQCSVDNIDKLVNLIDINSFKSEDIKLLMSDGFNRSKKMDITVVPFAFGGPCLTENSPVAILYEINKNIFYNFYEKDIIRQLFNESPLEYLKRVEKQLHDNKFKMVLGGNHLSILPVYKEAYKRNLNIISFDAHRDYKVETEISHASFLNEIKDEVIIFGYRDDLKDKKPENIRLYDINQKNEFLETVRRMNGNFLLDIDVDVMTPNEMYATYSAICGGLSVNDIKELIKSIGIERIEMFAISEYAYYLDSKKECLKIIMDIIDMIVMEKIKEW